MHNPHWTRLRCEPCQEAHGREYRREYSRARQREKLATPEGRQEHAAIMRKVRAANPERAREAVRWYQRRRFKTDPEFRERKRREFAAMKAGFRPGACCPWCAPIRAKGPESGGATVFGEVENARYGD